MASAPFSLATTAPQDNDIVSQFPLVERTFRDTVNSYLGTDHSATTGGHSKLTMIQTGSTPTFTTGQSGVWAKTDGTLRTNKDGGSTEVLGCPVGSILPTFTTVEPDGWEFCHGQAVGRVSQARLWAALGSPNTGDGSTTFNLPDLRGRTLFGRDDMGGSAAGRMTIANSGLDGTILGNAGGGPNQTIAQINLPNVAFTVSGIAATAQAQATSATRVTGVGNSLVTGSGALVSAATNSASTVDFSSMGTAASGGSGTAFSIIPSALVCNWIIKY